ncbi:MAG: DNA-directed RNA polymerase, subunit E'' [Candidatus Thermoplasmatota archaeon]|jgi:DNA-directed RNA polymerase subunit E"|nr:DNA-directed RNA polymerase, subunit E'' [Candidatus Thermoplasmatota archaeon]MCL5963344.1 DNA-directed RNA polymerase, subunit E'' [Candidatus Thermoplasmatota archaeon]
MVKRSVSTVLKACKKCKYITTEHRCPICDSDQLSREWNGYLVIIDYEKSEIAKQLHITRNGKYAVKVK